MSEASPAGVLWVLLFEPGFSLRVPLFPSPGQCSGRDELVGAGESVEWSQSILHRLRQDLAVHGVCVPRAGVCGGGAACLGRREQRLCV